MTLLKIAPTDTSEGGDTEPCSWKSIAAAVRRHALSQAAEEAADLERFAELLDGFAELKKQCGS